ncbi:MAG: nuclear transport factor 2 family protein [Terracidiphilus sp.]|jgi:ketosteroid isomerase-like protein
MVMLFLLKSIDLRGISGIVSVSSMHLSALHPFKPNRYRRLYALVFLLGLGAYVPALYSAPQHGGQYGAQHSGLPRGEKHEGRREIDVLEEKWRNAVLTGDYVVMGNLLADDYISISASGTLQTKEDTLTRMRSGQRHITAIEVSDSKVRFYGTTALVTSFAHVTGINADGEAIGDFRYTHVYARNVQGKWKMVSSESSRIREPGARK